MDKDHLVYLIVLLGPWYLIIAGGFVYYGFEWLCEVLREKRNGN